jgi:SAM-dependent methyltransferase
MNRAFDSGPIGSKEIVERLLACPKCRGGLEVATGACRSCSYKLSVAGNVLSTFENTNVSYFDDKHEIMSEATSDQGTWRLFYERQARRVEELVPKGAKVLDVGCGPAVPYRRGQDWFVIGLEPSLQSILANKSLDLRLHATSLEIPLADKSVDAILCFYSIHHMTGKSVPENREIVARSFAEFGRIVRPGGQLLIFDISPWWPFSALEVLAWSRARRTLGSKLDMFFWKANWLAKLGMDKFPSASLQIKRFPSSPFTLFAPIFYLPKLKVPRMLYPFAINFYRWQF